MGQNFSFLTMLLVKMCDILPKRKNDAPNFLYVAKYIKNVSENHQKVVKMLREKLVIFALDLKLDWATMTLVLTSAPKFLWSVVHFDK